MSMKIKTALDMQGNGIENFLIQGVSAIEGLSDKSLGRKILYTGTNTERNYREMIYIGNSIGGDGWRTTAYMSDVDELRGLITALENATDEEIEALKGRATTTEGNLATLRSEFDALNKALNEDTAGTIDTWNEIQNFVGKYDGSEDLETILSRMNAEIDGKLDLSGGTINGTDAIPLTLDTTATLQIGVRFSMNGVSKSFMGYNPADTYGTHMYNAASSNRIGILDNGTPYYGVGASAYTLLHADNFATQIGDYYLKTTGGTIDGNLQIGTNDNTQFNHLTIVRSGKAIRLNGYGTGMGLSFGSFSSGGTFTQEYQIAMSNYGLQYKESDKTYTILHTGNYSDLISVLNSNLTVKGQLKIDNANPSIQFANGNVTYGRLAWNANYGLVMTDSSWNKEYILLRNDNYSNLITTLNENVTFNAELIGKKETGGSFARWRIATSENGTFFQAGSVDSTKAQGVLYLSGINGTYLEKLNILSDLAVVSNRLHIGHIANDDGSALQINGDIHVTGNIIADGEVSAGGAATEGNGGAGGFSLYESWGTSAPTEPLALGANLGYELKTRVEDLELAKTKVTFEPALVSGKQIGAITIDGNKTNLFAPATYAWSEITGTENVLLKSGGTIEGALTLLKQGGDIFVINRLNSSSPTTITYRKDGGLLGRMGFDASTKEPVAQVSGTYQTLLHYGNYSSYALPLSGGTIAGNGAGLLAINRKDGNPVIEFHYNGSLMGRYGFATDGTPIGIVAGSQVTLLHSGNVGEYALKADGSNAMTGGIKWKERVLDSENAPQNSGLQLFSFVDSAISPGDASVYWSTLSAVTNYVGFQISSHGGATSSMNPRFRKMIDNGTWSDWKTIAFTDSDITGTAATATKLATPRTIWGQSFDGTGDVDGNIVSARADFRLYSNTNTLFLQSATSALILGEGTSATIPTYILGKEIYFGNGLGSTKMILNSSGNVTIGDRDKAITSAKLYVDGTIIGGSVGTSTLGWDASNTGLCVTSNGIEGWVSEFGNGTQGVLLGCRGASKNVASIGSVGGTTLALNPDSGNVLIGTTTDNGAELQVAGSSTILGALSASTSFDLNRNGDNGNIFNSERAAFEIETLAKIVRFRTFNPDVYNVLTFYGSQGNVGIGKVAYTHKLEVEGNVHISGSLIVDGEVSAGGTGTEGGNTGGGGGTGTITNPYVVTFTPSQETSHSFYHNLPYYDVVVQVYEKNAISGTWDMILADVTIANESRLVTVDFGRKENVEHKIVVR